jgi:hypothetical protein
LALRRLSSVGYDCSRRISLYPGTNQERVLRDRALHEQMQKANEERRQARVSRLNVASCFREYGAQSPHGHREAPQRVNIAGAV